MTPGQFRKRRYELRMSQSQIAERLGVHPRRISKWERGIARVPEIAARLLRHLRPMTRGGRAGVRRPKRPK